MGGDGPSLCRYELAPDDRANDLTRLQASLNRYKLVASFTGTAQAVTAVATANSFLSNIVLCAGSNRAVEVLATPNPKLTFAFAPSG